MIWRTLQTRRIKEQQMRFIIKGRQVMNSLLKHGFHRNKNQLASLMMYQFQAGLINEFTHLNPSIVNITLQNYENARVLAT
jgi:hypothetical protein